MRAFEWGASSLRDAPGVDVPNDIRTDWPRRGGRMVEPIYDETFGRLEWDSLLNCWLGSIDWPPGLHTEVAIWSPEGNTAAGLAAARAGLIWLQANGAHARRCVASTMLEVYNGAWRDEVEPITEDDFIRRIEIVRISSCDDGSLLASYDGRDLFGGHVIDGDFGPDRVFRGATLVG